jgi:hypothetical protein
MMELLLCSVNVHVHLRLYLDVYSPFDFIKLYNCIVKWCFSLEFQGQVEQHLTLLKGRALYPASRSIFGRKR